MIVVGPSGFAAACCVSPEAQFHTVNKASSAIFKPPLSHQNQGILDTYGDLNTVIGQDEGGVRAGELGGRHVDGWC
jgi:hypothetical protein